jgi:hypothetical protein
MLDMYGIIEGTRQPQARQFDGAHTLLYHARARFAGLWLSSQHHSTAERAFCMSSEANNMTSQVCEHCEREYPVSPSRVGVIRFCSKECRQQYTHAHSPAIYGTCKQCGKEFKAYEPQTFCSLECRVTYNHVERVCPTCGESFKVKPSHYDKKTYCSKACMAQDYKIRLSGKNNPHYQSAGQHICQVCGKGFQSYNKGRKYCSDVCSGKSPNNIAHLHKISSTPKPSLRKVEKQRNLTCKYCEQRFVAPTKRTYCSNECKALGKVGHMRGRTDKNQAAIIQVLRDVGASIIVTSDVGIPGFPDLVVGFRQTVHLLEVKNPENSYGRRGFNKNQKAWNEQWAGARPIIVYTPDDALRAIGAIE